MSQENVTEKKHYSITLNPLSTLPAKDPNIEGLLGSRRLKQSIDSENKGFNSSRGQPLRQATELRESIDSSPLSNGQTAQNLLSLMQQTILGEDLDDPLRNSSLSNSRSGHKDNSVMIIRPLESLHGEASRDSRDAPFKYTSIFNVQSPSTQMQSQFMQQLRASPSLKQDSISVKGVAVTVKLN